MASRVRRPSLDAVLAYRNTDVVDRFLAEWDVTPREARLLFEDTLRFLWLSMRSQHMVAPVRVIDLMWHTFLVFTESYEKWSRRTFGRMLHHIPTTEREKRIRRNRSGSDGLTEAIRADVATVFAELGEKVALRWYVLYPQKYGPAFFRKKRKPIKVSPAKFPKALVDRARKLNRGTVG